MDKSIGVGSYIGTTCSCYGQKVRKNGRAAHNSKGLILVGFHRDSDYKLDSSFELPSMFYARHFYIKIPV